MAYGMLLILEEGPVQTGGGTREALQTLAVHIWTTRVLLKVSHLAY